MGYNHASAFLPKPPKRDADLCRDCAAKIIAAAGMKFKAQHPEYEGAVEARILKDVRLVQLKMLASPKQCIHYTFEELDFGDAC